MCGPDLTMLDAGECSSISKADVKGLWVDCDVDYGWNSRSSLWFVWVVYQNTSFEGEYHPF